MTKATKKQQQQQQHLHLTETLFGKRPPFETNQVEREKKSFTFFSFWLFFVFHAIRRSSISWQVNLISASPVNTNIQSGKGSQIRKYKFFFLCRIESTLVEQVDAEKNKKAKSRFWSYKVYSDIWPPGTTIYNHKSAVAVAYVTTLVIHCILLVTCANCFKAQIANNIVYQKCFGGGHGFEAR